jgi:two-component system, cell cycle sensor histidine kinase and response regulator CckA
LPLECAVQVKRAESIRGDTGDATEPLDGSDVVGMPNPARMAALIQAAGDALELSNENGKVTYASPSVEHMLGVTPRARLGESLFDRVHPDDEADARARHATALENPGQQERFEHRQRHADGKYHHIRGAHVSHLDAPAIAAVVTTYRDVTERRDLEERMLQAQKMEAIGRLAGGIAHDFNNMLTVIGGVARMIQDELEPGDELLADLDEITKAADRAAALTHQLLAFGRKQVLKPRVIDPSEHVREMEKLLRRVIGEDIILEIELSSSAWPVKVDPGQLEQAILNLVANARDAMPNGGTLVIATANIVLDREHVAELHDVASGPYVMLTVADTGSGMTRHVLDHLFEPFFTTKAAGLGSGLGLATVFGIVKQSGGHVEASSEPGRGSTLRLYLPRSDEAPSSRAERQRRIPGLSGRETVLLVEDDAAVRQVVKRALVRHGYRVLEASNGGEAVLIAEEQDGDIDLLVSDLVMPRVGGRQVAERILRIRPGVRVLFMSGYAQDQAPDAEELGRTVDFLEKPATPEEILRKVREVLDRPR